uniref:Uncharacterized protein n=1 Tax=uncultured prokaryote TaxID=198431 RepID=A0A0H5Q7W3_9ZZZZ|nr:hypothetical protein [uncultured prokaryote]
MSYSSDWYQQQLVNPEVIEITLKIGAIPSENHGQWWIELRDASGDCLLGQWSSYGFDLRHLPAELVKLIDLVQTQLDGSMETF